MSHSKHYPGTYIGEVVAVDDPEKRCRVKVKVYDIFDGVPEAALPWANCVLPPGAREGEGTVTPVRIGDMVWVQFVQGDSRRPLILGAAQASPGGVVTLAPDAFQGAGTYAHKRSPRQPPVPNPPYYEDVVCCQNRALIQLCRSGTIRVTQMDSGSAVEILPNGDMVLHCEGNMFVSVAGDVLEEVSGNVERNIGGNLTETIFGRMQLNVAGGITATGATASVQMDGESCTVKAAKINLN